MRDSAEPEQVSGNGDKHRHRRPPRREAAEIVATDDGRIRFSREVSNTPSSGASCSGTEDEISTAGGRVLRTSTDQRWRPDAHGAHRGRIARLKLQVRVGIHTGEVERTPTK